MLVYYINNMLFFAKRINIIYYLIQLITLRYILNSLILFFKGYILYFLSFYIMKKYFFTCVTRHRCFKIIHVLYNSWFRSLYLYIKPIKDITSCFFKSLFTYYFIQQTYQTTFKLKKDK